MSSLDFNHLDSFNQGGLKTRLTKKQKIVIAAAAVLVIAVVASEARTAIAADGERCQQEVVPVIVELAEEGCQIVA